MHRLLPAFVLVLAAARAFGFDVTQCGTTVPQNTEAFLLVDLNCPSLTQGQANPPAITMSKRTILHMNGHTVTAPGNTAIAAISDENTDPDGLTHRMTILGPGEITGADNAIRGHAKVTASDLDVHDNLYGITTITWSKRGKLILTDVSVTNTHRNAVGGAGGVAVQGSNLVASRLTVTHADFDGIYAYRVVGHDVVASDNGENRPTSYGSGVSSISVNLRNLVATGNSGNGVIATRIRLVDSTLTGNTGDPTGDVDVFADRHPQLRNTICGKSNGWGVCANDASSPSGAFVDGPQ